MMEERMNAVEEAATRHELWHQDIGRKMQQFADALDQNTAEQRRIKEVVDVNTRDTAAIKSDTAELLELFRSWRGAMRVLGWLSKPIVAMVTFVGAVGGAIAAYLAIWPKK